MQEAEPAHEIPAPHDFVVFVVGPWKGDGRHEVFAQRTRQVLDGSTFPRLAPQTIHHIAVIDPTNDAKVTPLPSQCGPRDCSPAPFRAAQDEPGISGLKHGDPLDHAETSILCGLRRVTSLRACRTSLPKPCRPSDSPSACRPCPCRRERRHSSIHSWNA